MPQHQLTGSRIRERRVLRGMRQADLARQAGISASYLNLIEHNRRRIGGKLLLSIAEALGVESSFLSEGAEAALIATLGEARAAEPEAATGEDQAQDFAGRFPGWAELLSRRHRRVLELERTVEALNDRLTHDPHLAAALHEVLSSVTAVRSAAGILVETPELEPEWRDRFLRNINEDAARLAESAQSLVTFLDDDGEVETSHASPQEEVDVLLAKHGYHFPQLEQEGQSNDAQTQTLMDQPELSTTASRSLAQSYFQIYQSDVASMPLAKVRAHVEAFGYDPCVLAQAFDVSVGQAMRRIASLPPAEGRAQIGMVTCDASGTLIFRKPIPGFALPRFGSACPKWPLFQALTRPAEPIKRIVEQDSRGEQMFEAYAIAEAQTQPSFDEPTLFHAHMLVVPLEGTAKPAQAPGLLGVSCRICPRLECSGRREPSILTDGF